MLCIKFYPFYAVVWTKMNEFFSVYTEHKASDRSYWYIYPDFPKWYRYISNNRFNARQLSRLFNSNGWTREKKPAKHFILKVRDFELKLNRMEVLYTTKHVRAIEFLVETIELFSKF